MAEAFREHRSGAWDRDGPSVGRLQSRCLFGGRWSPLSRWKVWGEKEGQWLERRAVEEGLLMT